MGFVSDKQLRESHEELDRAISNMNKQHKEYNKLYDDLCDTERELFRTKTELQATQVKLQTEVSKLDDHNKKLSTRCEYFSKLLGEFGASVDDSKDVQEKLYELYQEQEQLTQQQAELVQEQKDINNFYAADQDHDGFVTREEAKEIGILHLFDKLDVNKDDRLSMAEIRGAAQEFEPSPKNIVRIFIIEISHLPKLDTNECTNTHTLHQEMDQEAQKAEGNQLKRHGSEAPAV
ncbi:hypothetical protein CYMTET_22489 [Cymbomonas tetramitiformis]|uniref:EF-hand domain-containing protein n=1 Tax=Cymbomonas tetramitiformis TaxID=36881 RepID=A0AAE0L1X8_9CHLO|nr:hypothetical protein CYMTET_22489 [Cymbomonas tetramitiformis]